MKALPIEISDFHWRGLYKISGITTVVMMIFFLFDTICWVALGPYPSSAEGWFSLLQENRFAGMLLLSFPTFFGTILYYLTFLCLYNILKPVNTAYAALAATLAIVGLAILLATHLGYPMINLFDQYALTATEEQRTMFLAAGEARIATTVTGANIGGLLAEGALVIFSFLMLGSKVFNRGTAYIGILGHGLDLIRIAMNLAFLPEGIGAILLAIGGLPQLIWMILVSRKFFQISNAISQT
jgi:hypothetical protein